VFFGFRKIVIAIPTLSEEACPPTRRAIC